MGRNNRAISSPLNWTQFSAQLKAGFPHPKEILRLFFLGKGICLLSYIPFLYRFPVNKFMKHIPKCFKLDRSLERFSIQSRYQKPSGSLNKAKLPIVTLGNLAGVGGGLVVFCFYKQKQTFTKGHQTLTLLHPWVQRVGTACHRSWHWKGSHRLYSFWDMRFCSQTGMQQRAPTLSSAAKSSLFQVPERKEALQKHGWAQADPR